MIKISQILKEDNLKNNQINTFNLNNFVLKEIKKWNLSKKNESDFDDLIQSVVKHLGYKNIKDNYEKVSDYLLLSIDEDGLILADIDLVRELYDVLESKFTIKRKYTELYPARNVYTNTKIKTKILEIIGDNKISNQEFDKILKELNANKKWFNRNLYLFKIYEDGIELSKYGKRLLNILRIINNVNENFNELEFIDVNIENNFDELIQNLNNLKIKLDSKTESEIEKIINGLLNLKRKYMTIKLHEDLKIIFNTK